MARLNGFLSGGIGFFEESVIFLSLYASRADKNNEYGGKK